MGAHKALGDKLFLTRSRSLSIDAQRLDAITCQSLLQYITNVSLPISRSDTGSDNTFPDIGKRERRRRSRISLHRRAWQSRPLLGIAACRRRPGIERARDEPGESIGRAEIKAGRAGNQRVIRPPSTVHEMTSRAPLPSSRGPYLCRRLSRPQSSDLSLTESSRKYKHVGVPRGPGQEPSPTSIIVSSNRPSSCFQLA